MCFPINFCIFCITLEYQNIYINALNFKKVALKDFFCVINILLNRRREWNTDTFNAGWAGQKTSQLSGNLHCIRDLYFEGAKNASFVLPLQAIFSFLPLLSCGSSTVEILQDCLRPWIDAGRGWHTYKPVNLSAYCSDTFRSIMCFIVWRVWKCWEEIFVSVKIWWSRLLRCMETFPA